MHVALCFAAFTSQQSSFNPDTAREMHRKPVFQASDHQITRSLDYRITITGSPDSATGLSAEC
jgi:hypothetical protein